MAITTFSELKTAIANWLNRSDLTDRIPEFIDLCETELDRQLRTTDQLTRSTTPITGQYASLPTDFLEIRNIQLDTSPVKRLQYLTPDRLDDERRTTYRSSGEPVYYSILGNNMEFAPTPDTTYTLQIAYYARLTKLSDSNTTNFLITNHPDIYLYGSLKHAEPFLMNDERIVVWGTLYERALEQLRLQEEAQKTGDGMMQMKPKYRLDTGAWK